jgi:hypothetical protein
MERRWRSETLGQSVETLRSEYYIERDKRDELRTYKEKQMRMIQIDVRFIGCSSRPLSFIYSRRRGMICESIREAEKMVWLAKACKILAVRILRQAARAPPMDLSLAQPRSIVQKWGWWNWQNAI